MMATGNKRYILLNNGIRHTLIRHLFYWVSYVCFFGIIWGTYDMDFKKTFSIELICLPLKVALVYIVINKLMPALLFKKRIADFWACFVCTLLAAALLQRLLDSYVIMQYYLPNWANLPTFHPVAVLTSAVQMLAVLVLPATFKLFRFFTSVEQRQQHLEKEKLEAELMFLKSQVQPHFLFNTLNSLYSLIIKRSDLVLDVFLRLSALLRYLLYEANAASIQLFREVDFVVSYIELERVRFGKTVQISIKTEGDFSNKLIAPLLIIPFIENSVKHSTGGYNQTAKISVRIAQAGDMFMLDVKNNIAQHTADIEAGCSGIGLRNVRKRLDILYAGRHELIINETEKSFGVTLKIDLRQP